MFTVLGFRVLGLGFRVRLAFLELLHVADGMIAKRSLCVRLLEPCGAARVALGVKLNATFTNRRNQVPKL